MAKWLILARFRRFIARVELSIRLVALVWAGGRLEKLSEGRLESLFVDLGLGLLVRRGHGCNVAEPEVTDEMVIAAMDLDLNDPLVPTSCLLPEIYRLMYAARPR